MDAELDPDLEREKFKFKKALLEKWDKPSTIGAFLFAGALAIALLLSFFGIAAISEAVQIFMIGVIMFILVFRYFKELTVGAISGKVGPASAIQQTFYSTGMQDPSDITAGSPERGLSARDSKPTLPKGTKG